MTAKQEAAKRSFDLAVALIACLVMLPCIVILAIGIKLTSPGPVFFVQQRVGRYGRRFDCVKLRTMSVGAEKGGSVTTLHDVRVTRYGRALRRWKLDEIPQLWNILKGDMSFVGPRPDVPGYADRLSGSDRAILTLRPGLTGPASMLFRNEESLLAAACDPLRFNDEVLYPAKVEINKLYSSRWSFRLDIACIAATVVPAASQSLGLGRTLGIDPVDVSRRMEQMAAGY